MKIKLATLVQRRNLYAKLYSGITDFDRIVEIDNKTIEPMDKALKAHDKLRDSFQKQIRDKEADEETCNKKYQQELEKDIDINFVKVTKDEARQAKFNVFEYRQIKHLIK